MKRKKSNINISLKKNALFFFKILFVFIFILFTSLPLSAAEIKVEPSPNNTEAIIYVSPETTTYGETNVSYTENEATIYIVPGTIIYGEKSISNAKIKYITNNSIAKKKFNDKNNALGLSEEFIPQKKVKDKSLKRFQDKANKKIKNTFYTSIPVKKALLFEKSRIESGIVSSSSSFFNFGNVVISNTSLAGLFMVPIAKQNTSTHIACVERLSLKNSFLRGPPLT